MRVALVSDHLRRGGAAIACNRLAEALAGQGIEVRRFALERGPRPPKRPKLEFAAEPFGRRAMAFSEALSGLGLAGAAERLRLRDAAQHLPAAVAAWRPDVINLHNLHGFAPQFHSADALAAIAPVVWTLHDMWSFTGRCAYAFECRRFETGCDASCPTPDEYPALPRDRIAAAWQERARFFARHRRLAAATPSQWLAAEARRGLWRDHIVEAIPNSLDTRAYTLIDQAVARAALGLPPRRFPAILIAADYLNERRKGGHLLRAALGSCGREIELLSLGHGTPTDLPANIHVQPLGYIDHERMKALVYASADVLLHAAPADNFPNTILEALACGTRVIGFRTGGVPEMIRTPDCGRIVDSIDAQALGTALGEVLSVEPWSPAARAATRDAILPLIEPAVQAGAYVNLFQRLLALAPAAGEATPAASAAPARAG